MCVITFFDYCFTEYFAGEKRFGEQKILFRPLAPLRFGRIFFFIAETV
jgi:hypothetical protein